MEIFTTTEFFVMLAILLAALIYSYWRDSMIDKKLGKIHAVMMRIRNKKLYQYRHLGFIAQNILITALLLGLYVLFFKDDNTHSNPMTILVIVALPGILAGYRPMTFGENGVVLGNDMFAFKRAKQFIPWDTIRDVEWDRDLGQIGWGFKIYLKKGGTPVKGVIVREYQPQAAELFKKFVKSEGEHENILV